jgi:competence protein ComEA
MLHQRVVMALVAVAMTVVLLAKGRQTGDISGLTAFSADTTVDTMVQISGDVAHPGIYTIIDKKMTGSVIQMSTPLCNRVLDRSDMQLLSGLRSGDAVDISCKSHGKKPFIKILPMNTKQCLTLGIPLELNLMSEADFELLPGIGPVLAKKIIQYRQKNGEFVKIEDLLQIDGIGDKKLKNISHYVKIPVQHKKSE